MKKVNEDTQRLKSDGNPAANKGFSKKSVIDTVKSLGGIILLALVIKTTILEAYQIPTGSMEDTILIGDFILGNKFLYGVKIPFTNLSLPSIRDPRPGDVVIFRFPEDRSVNYVKRCVAVGGQTIEIRRKKLYVDGVRVEGEPFLKNMDHRTYPPTWKDHQIYPPGAGNRDYYGPVTTPEGHIFVMGDNRDNSYDSRFWGFVPLEDVLGQGLIIYWSWDRDIPLYNFFRRVRWSRVGSTIR